MSNGCPTVIVEQSVETEIIAVGTQGPTGPQGPAGLGGTNMQQTIFGSAARTTSQTSTVYENPGDKGAHFIVDITAVTGSAEIEVTIEAEDATSGKFYPLLTSPMLRGTGTLIMKIRPSYQEQPELTANDNLPFRYRVSVLHGNSDSITYSIGANLVL